MGLMKFKKFKYVCKSDAKPGLAGGHCTTLHLHYSLFSCRLNKVAQLLHQPVTVVSPSVVQKRIH